MKIGSVCSGYGGLDAGWIAAAGGAVEWVSEINKDAIRVLGDVHNLGDLTTVDWGSVPRVDVLTAGYPCQPFSMAGSRKGREDDRHLWPSIANAISVIRPHYVFLENVRGHLTLGFADVLGDLARLGFNARWGVVRASDIGAPHQRARLFVLAYPQSRSWDALTGWGHTESDGTAGPPAHVSETAADTFSARRREQGLTGGHAKEKPATRTDTGMPSDSDASRREGHGTVAVSPRIGAAEYDRLDSIAWGKYEPAIRRWEQLTRPAPPPTILGKRRRLNPLFVEWMMGLPEGHVTGHGLKPNACLQLLGNGVVPQQAARALHLLAEGPS